MCLENLRDKRREKLENDGAVFFLKWRSFDRGSNENNRDIILGVPRIKFKMGVSLQKVAGLSGVLKVALSDKNSGKLGQNSGKQSISLISIG